MPIPAEWSQTLNQIHLVFIFKRYLNWNNKRELTKNQIAAVTNFHMLKLLTLELETVKSSMKYLSSNCDTEKVLLDFDVKSEISKILDDYGSLKGMEEIKLENSAVETLVACSTENTPKEAINDTEGSMKKFPSSNIKKKIFLKSPSTPQ